MTLKRGDRFKVSIEQKVIHLDVGCWQSHENEEPIQTFALIEHNAVALCSYYSNGKIKKSCHIIAKKNPTYDFYNSLIAKFLDRLLFEKYGKNVIPFLKNFSWPNAKDFHIKEIILFPSGTLINDTNKLLIYIPDTHLHYFKLSYLDNFVTWYVNTWKLKYGRPFTKKLKKRISMENDFYIFLKSIELFQNDKNIGANTTVTSLGDLTEMWETQITISNFLTKDDKNNKFSIKSRIEQKKTYIALNNAIKSLYKIVHPGNKKIHSFLEELIDLKIDQFPINQTLTIQLTDLVNNKKELEKIYFKNNESKEEFYEKAIYLEEKILKKYKSKNGENFLELFRKLCSNYIVGNHDNFKCINSLKPLTSITINYTPKRKQFKYSYPGSGVRAQSKYLTIHGHNIEMFNNDESCFLGYFITTMLNLFEAKKRGDLLKKFESVVTGDSHIKYISTIIPILSTIEKKRNDKKNILIIHAHTHHPYLADITTHFKLFNYLSSLPKPIRRQVKKGFIEKFVSNLF